MLQSETHTADKRHTFPWRRDRRAVVEFLVEMQLKGPTCLRPGSSRRLVCLFVVSPSVILSSSSGAKAPGPFHQRLRGHFTSRGLIVPRGPVLKRHSEEVHTMSLIQNTLTRLENTMQVPIKTIS